MVDPLSIIASTLTVADTSTKIISMCGSYISHVRKAPQELLILQDDIRDLKTTVKKVVMSVVPSRYADRSKRR